MITQICYVIKTFRDQKAAGSNPATSTVETVCIAQNADGFFIHSCLFCTYVHYLFIMFAVCGDKLGDNWGQLAALNEKDTWYIFCVTCVICVTFSHPFYIYCMEIV